MAARKGVVVVIVLFVLLMSASNYLLWSKLSNARERATAVQEASRSREVQYLRVRETFEGKPITAVVPAVEKYRFNLTEHPATLVLVIRSLECATCFEFHVERIRRLNLERSVPVVVYGVGRYAMLARRALPFSVVFGDSLASPMVIRTSDIVPPTEFALFLTNHAGQIVYVDIADQADYSRSETFYAIVGSYLKSANQVW